MYSLLVASKGRDIVKPTDIPFASFAPLFAASIIPPPPPEVIIYLDFLLSNSLLHVVNFFASFLASS